jgi:hypothetical protein
MTAKETTIDDRTGEAIFKVTSAIRRDSPNESLETIVDYCIAEFGRMKIESPYIATLYVLDNVEVDYSKE